MITYKLLEINELSFWFVGGKNIRRESFQPLGEFQYRPSGF
jgi:hypothetical protein